VGSAVITVECSIQSNENSGQNLPGKKKVYTTGKLHVRHIQFPFKMECSLFILDQLRASQA
jgi:hypothetical protein